jgi:hypothetical protein
MDVLEDGVLVGTTTVTRTPGSPDEQIKTISFLRVDVLNRPAPQIFDVALRFTPAPGATEGENPVWVLIHPTRTPVEHLGEASIVFKSEFNVRDPASWLWTIHLTNLKVLLLRGGDEDMFDDRHGFDIDDDDCENDDDFDDFEDDADDMVFIDFEVEAFDPGTDDMAFAWIWGDPMTTIEFEQGDSEWKRMQGDTVHMYNNNGQAMSERQTLGPSKMLGFTEPFFDRALNSVRSSLGQTNFRVHDVSVHAFMQLGRYYWVSLVVLDDDNGRGYSSTFRTDGIDMEFIELDLTCPELPPEDDDD